MTVVRPRHAPVVFEEFFELGQEESKSPFLTQKSAWLSTNLHLRAAILSSVLLICAFILSFIPGYGPLSSLTLLFVYFLAGTTSLIEAIEDLSNWDVNIDVLMTLAAFSSVLIGSSMEGALLLVLFNLSHSMEEAVTSKAKGSISGLKKLSPSTATIIEDGKLIERAVQDIDVGTILLVKSGQVVPLDGSIIDGTSSVNLVHLTGENFPIPKKTGDTIAAGARNLEGALTIKVTRTSAESTLAKIIEMVTQAQEARPLLQRWFDKLSRKYAITIILLAVFFALSFPFVFSMPFLGYEGSIYRALAFLIAASPCALIIAIPIAYLSAVGACARNGILIKGGITFDALASCKMIALDKTGTLTTGELVVDKIEPLEPTDTADVHLAESIAFALERNAVHPIAKAIVANAQKQGLSPAPITQFRAIPGEGLEALYFGEMVAIGHAAFITKKVSENQARLIQVKSDEAKKDGKLVAVLLFGKKCFLFRLSDTLRKDMKKTIDTLQSDNKYKLVMLTGDHEENARRTAQELGITHYFANLSPEDKLTHVANLAKTHGLAMVGDGINDAPALARATVGICMGQIGSTAAMDAADVVLLQDNIDKLDWLMKKAKKTTVIVRQNLFLASAAILVATTPALAGWIPLWLAVVLHEGGTVLVGLNGLRLLNRS